MCLSIYATLVFIDFVYVSVHPIPSFVYVVHCVYIYIYVYMYTCTYAGMYMCYLPLKTFVLFLFHKLIHYPRKLLTGRSILDDRLRVLGL